MSLGAFPSPVAANASEERGKNRNETDASEGHALVVVRGRKSFRFSRVDVETTGELSVLIDLDGAIPLQPSARSPRQFRNSR